MGNKEEILKQLAALDTERVNPRTTNIDELSALEVVRLINAEDRTVANVVAAAADRIAAAAQKYADTLRNHGRVFYIGAGTSGRLGVLDAAECPPTFGSDPEQIVGLISGGYATLVLSMEGVEDDRDAAVNDLDKKEFGAGDMLIGIAASTRTPYTLAGLEHAHSLGATTAFIVCNQMPEPPDFVDILISLPVGPEVVTGSTRMKSGTAQKLALNSISTTAMVLLGKTYGNLMVDLQARSEKLVVRSRKILIDLFGMDLPAADDLLNSAGGSVKLAIVMHQFKCDPTEAAAKLEQADGFISRCK